MNLSSPFKFSHAAPTKPIYHVSEGSGVGHMAKLPGFAENAPESLKKLMEKDPSIAQYITSQVDKMKNGDKETFEDY